MKLFDQHIPASGDTLEQGKYKILQGVWMIDTQSIPDRTFCRFVYFFPKECMFVVTDKQLYKFLILKTDPLHEINIHKVFEIVSYKYSFATLLVGLFVSRRLISAQNFLRIVTRHRDWF